MMRWDTVALENFLSWESATLSLRSGVTLVLGENADADGHLNASNGAGKSSLWDAVTWALFGKTIRGLSGDEVIRRGCDSCSASVSFRDADGVRWVVGRVRGEEGRLTLTRNGTLVSRATATQVQEAIETVLGHDYKSFLAATIFGQDVTRWATYTDREQKILLERLIGTTVWEDALKEVRRKAAGVDMNYELRQSELAHAKESLQRAQERLLALDEEEKAWQAERARDLKKLEKERVELTDARDKLKGRVAKLTKAREEAQAVVNDLMARNEGAQLAARERERLAVQMESYRVRCEDLERRLMKVRKGILDPGTPCPTCKRPLDMTSAREACRESVKESRTITEEIKTSLSEVEVLEGKLNRVPEYVPDGDLTEAQAMERDLRDREALVSRQLLELGSQLKVLSLRIDGLKGDDGKFAKARESLDLDVRVNGEGVINAEEKIAQLSEERQALAWLEKACGPSGVRSYLLDATLPKLNAWVNEALQVLGPGMAVEITAQSTLKSQEVREKIRCTIRSDGAECAYESLSAGERQRVDIAVALALQRLAAERTPMGLAVFDEIFERLDADGCERVARLLLKLGQSGGACYVITHNESLKGLFSECILISKRGGVSALAQSPATVNA